MVANSVNRSVMSDSVTPGTVARQAPLSMEFSRQEYWSGLAIPFPRGLPNPGIEPGSPAVQADCLPSEPPGKPWETGEEYERMDRRNQNLLKKKFMFTYWLFWVLIAFHGLSLVAVSGDHTSLQAQASHHCGLSACRALPLGGWASVVAACWLGSRGAWA